MKKIFSLFCVAAFAFLLAPCGYCAEGSEKPAEPPVQVKNSKTEGNVTTDSERYYDADGKPALGKDGYFEKKTETKNNASGKFESSTTSYLGVDGKLVNNDDGFAKMSISYHNKLTQSVEYFDENDQPVASPDSLFGVARTDIIRDAATGNPREIKHYGVDGKPMNSRHGPAVETIETIPMPDGGTMTKTTYYDVNGKFTELEGCIPSQEVVKNSKDEETGGRFFDETGATRQATIDSMTFASWRMKKGLKLFGKQITDDSVILYDVHGNHVKTIPEKDFIMKSL